MGTITGKAIIDRVANVLSDNNNLRWPRAELLRWLNDGQRHIALAAPVAVRTVATRMLVAGTRQSIPADGFLLLDIHRNMPDGKAVRVASRTHLDAYEPDWHARTKTKIVQNWLFDRQDKDDFWVYPPNDGTGALEITYAKTPVDLANEAAVIVVDDLYQTALVDYILFRANSKQTEWANPTVAAAYFGSFVSAIGQRTAAEADNNPNLALGPHDPSKEGSQS